MIRKLALIALPLALCAAPAFADDSTDLDAAVTALYAPYGADAPDWDTVRALKNYSAATEALIGEWDKGLPEDEVTELGDFDWLCECQDWDSSAFKLVIQPHPAPADGKAEVTAKIELGFDETRSERFLMVKEGGAWKVDDIFSEAFPKGLRAALKAAIANPRVE
ncbi:MAG: DUF3828 domain-containing protein [Candidatus Andeanibacterium colombiense]|uniref:DUF3828 domain-containing protein n=1 Tax=Candidatus Andeanibacterium colombiense TaxID=3121345 RepID=A0AAJ6BNP1_9SPHN|nr:MAG: DUF3828 domain-containing protein [Sphingomonadaceae bacterium]